MWPDANPIRDYWFDFVKFDCCTLWTDTISYTHNSLVPCLTRQTSRRAQRQPRWRRPTGEWRVVVVALANSFVVVAMSLLYTIIVIQHTVQCVFRVTCSIAFSNSIEQCKSSIYCTQRIERIDCSRTLWWQLLLEFVSSHVVEYYKVVHNTATPDSHFMCRYYQYSSPIMAQNASVCVCVCVNVQIVLWCWSLVGALETLDAFEFSLTTFSHVNALSISAGRA